VERRENGVECPNSTFTKWGKRTGGGGGGYKLVKMDVAISLNQTTRNAYIGMIWP
jgi:hypothetical protein